MQPAGTSKKVGSNNCKKCEETVGIYVPTPIETERFAGSLRGLDSKQCIEEVGLNLWPVRPLEDNPVEGKEKTVILRHNDICPILPQELLQCNEA